MAVAKVLNLQEAMKLKGGENRHLKAWLLAATDDAGKPLGQNIYSPDHDLGAKTRLPGWTNIGDISACLRTSIGLGEVYSSSTTPHIAVASKHTRPVVIAKGKTQLEATIKAIAGDLNSPFGGFWGFNTPVTKETAEFLDRMFFEGTIAPEFDQGAVERLKTHKSRFLISTGYLDSFDIDPFRCSLQPVACGYVLEQTREDPFDVKKEAVVVTGNNGNTDIRSLEEDVLDDIQFAGNVALYLSSNLVFFVHDGAIAGLGDGCGARIVAAEKARSMLEKSAYATLSESSDVFSEGTDELWKAVLYDTPFTKEDFQGIKMPLRLVAFSDAFFPKLDGFVETTGIDRTNALFGEREVEYEEKGEKKTFIPKRNNFDNEYDHGLIPKVVVQPGGSLGDKVILPIAEENHIKMVFTMTPKQLGYYLRGEKDPETGRTPTGRRFFGHIIM